MFRKGNDIKLHIDKVEPVGDKMKSYGFARQLHAFIVENPARTNRTTQDIGKTYNIDVLSRPHDTCNSAGLCVLPLCPFLTQ